uniref:FAD-dependent oxidoreductase 2 FAD-binding domain-containing protein n=1 Tax=mine drainage metagenome TaxID=410659 RepID=E6PCV1_9ZZZZ
MRERAYDVAVVGAGIAGLMAAYKLAPLRVAVLCKRPLGRGAATDWAQGGIAAAIGSDDSPALHAQDTRLAGAGLSDESIAEILANDAPARIEELLELGAAFDRTADGELALGREAAHQRRRIVKAGGDATGHEILRTLIAAVAASDHIDVIADTIVEDLLVDGERRVAGVIGRSRDLGERFIVRARATILATGGFGHIHGKPDGRAAIRKNWLQVFWPETSVRSRSGAISPHGAGDRPRPDAAGHRSDSGRGRVADQRSRRAFYDRGSRRCRARASRCRCTRDFRTDTRRAQRRARRTRRDRRRVSRTLSNGFCFLHFGGNRSTHRTHSGRPRRALSHGRSSGR